MFRRDGFALIVSLAVLALVAALVVVIYRWQVGMLDRTPVAWSHELARAHAELAVRRAEAQLMTHLGPDQATTRFGSEAPGWLEAWQTGPRPERRAWLVTTAPADAPTRRLGDAEVPLAEVIDTQGHVIGRMGWWIDDEGMKAHLARLEPPASPTTSNPAVDYVARRAFRADAWVRPVDTLPFASLADLPANVPAEAFTVWSQGVLADPAAGGLRANAGMLPAVAVLADAPDAFDMTRESLRAQPGGPAPVVTEALFAAGVFLYGAPNPQGRYRLALRFYVEAELWNPYPWPLELSTDTYDGTTSAARLVWKGLPSVRVTSLRQQGGGWVVRDQTDWLPLDDLVREGPPPERNLASWIEIPGARLEAGEVFRAQEPDVASQPRGLVRTVAEVFNVVPQLDRLQVEIRYDGLADTSSLHLLPAGPANADGYAVEPAYWAQKDLRVDEAATSWTFTPPLSVSRDGQPATYLRTSDDFRPANAYLGLHWRLDEAAALTRTDALPGTHPDGEGTLATLRLSGYDGSRIDTSGYWQSPRQRTHASPASLAIWKDWPLAPVASWGEVPATIPTDLDRYAWPTAPGLAAWPASASFPAEGDPALAAQALQEGAFNLNSPHPAAWRALLSAGFPHRYGGEGDAYRPTSGELRDDLGLARAASLAPARSLSDAQLDQIAARLAALSRSRTTPFTSLAEWVTSPEVDAVLAAVGPAFMGPDGPVATCNPLYTEAERLEGAPALGLPGVLDADDLRARLAPIAAVRSDTFRVLVYGEAVLPETGAVTGRAWGEAIYQRTPTLRDDGTGRVFVCRGFRWLMPD